MPLNIIRNDITKMDVDAIVNAANTELCEGGGVCGAIFQAAGPKKLREACRKLAPIKTGEAVITKGFDLKARHVIHTAGPVYHDGKHKEEELLRSCYVSSLDLAARSGCDSIAFPLISSGIYGYPKDEALAVATGAIGEWLMRGGDMDVSLVVFDKAAFALTNELHGEIKAFIGENYVDELNSRFESRIAETWVEYAVQEADRPAPAPAPAPAHARPVASMISHKAGTYKSKRQLETGLDKTFMELDEPFSDALLRLIDAKGRTDVDIYKRANLDRKLFSKIRTGKGYMPSKKTALALAVALELSLAETRDLLERAGFALSRSVMFDVIIEYFITRRKYDIFEINNVLFEYDQPLLGG